MRPGPPVIDRARSGSRGGLYGSGVCAANRRSDRIVDGGYHRRMAPSKRGSGPAFTVEFPHTLDARRDGDAWWFEIDGRELRLSNLNKVFWPDEGYTKGDLVAYYLNVADLIVPHLSGRPLTLKRMPDGSAGPFFYEKSAPSHVPAWIGRCQVRSADAKRGVIDSMPIADAEA